MSHLPPIDPTFLATPAIVLTSPTGNDKYSKIENTEATLALLAQQIAKLNEIITNAEAQKKIHEEQYAWLYNQRVLQKQIDELERQLASPVPFPIVGPRAETPKERLKKTTNAKELLDLVGQKVDESSELEPKSKRIKYTHPQTPLQSASSTNMHPTAPPCYFAPIPQYLSLSDQTPTPTPALSPSPDSTPVLMPLFSPYLNSSQSDQTPVPLQSPTPSPAPIAEIPSRPVSPWKMYLE